MVDYLLVAGLVLAVNVLPALGPPTWAVLIFLKLNLAVAAVPLVIVALAAAGGRLALAHGARRLRGSFSEFAMARTGKSHAPGS